MTYMSLFTCTNCICTAAFKAAVSAAAADTAPTVSAAERHRGLKLLELNQKPDPQTQATGTSFNTIIKMNKLSQLHKYSTHTLPL